MRPPGESVLNWSARGYERGLLLLALPRPTRGRTGSPQQVQQLLPSDLNESQARHLTEHPQFQTLRGVHCRLRNLPWVLEVDQRGWRMSTEAVFVHGSEMPRAKWRRTAQLIQDGR